MTYFTYWLRPDLLSHMRTSEELPVNNDMSAEEIWGHIHRRGFSYILYDKSSHQELAKIWNIENTPPWVLLRKLYEKDQLSLYLIDYDFTRRTPSNP